MFRRRRRLRRNTQRNIYRNIYRNLKFIRRNFFFIYSFRIHDRLKNFSIQNL